MTTAVPQRSKTTVSQTNSPVLAKDYVLLIYAITIFVSAFLLFQVQPLISKFILPWFGGSPAVWTAAMLFFQMVLFGGYLYAHLSCTYLKPTSRFLVHLGLLLLALASVASNRLVPPEAFRPQGTTEGEPLWNVLLLLGVTVGLPYFALSATGPLLQKWFSELCPHVSPYRLFSLSNVGSLLALVSYPFLFEIFWGVQTQAALWSSGFVVFVAGCTTCALLVWKVERPESPAAGARALNLEATAVPTWREVVAWIGLPTLASVMFLAVTNEVCQNVASVPLLWIIPLGLYLGSFIITFDHPRWYSRTVFSIGTIVLLMVVVRYDFAIECLEWGVNVALRLPEDREIALGNAWWLQVAVYFVAMFAVAILAHGELASLKPISRYLTLYYLTISLGGAVGGMFVNLVAPQVFVSFFEFPIAIAAAMSLAAGLLFTNRPDHPRVWQPLLRYGAPIAAIVTCVWLGIDFFPATQTESKVMLYEARNFYGLVGVERRSLGEAQENFSFFSGHVQHGNQFAAADKRHLPTTYYGAGSGCEIAVHALQRRQPAIRIGVVGLGVGTMAAYARAEDKLRFYELNPLVVQIANNSDWFHFLADCKCTPEIVLGDARLQLEHELRNGQPQNFDLLVLDAFSGDSVPTHLLTREAFELYTRHLKPDGVIACNITNTYLDLYPVLKTLAEEADYGHRRIYCVSDLDQLLYRNYFVLVSKDAAFIRDTPDQIDDLPEYLRRHRSIPVWTDDYTNLTGLLR